MKSIKALIVDDSTTSRKVIIKHLSDSFDVNAVEAADGAIGLDLASAAPFDIIISDVNMPNMDGLELCKRLKEQPHTKNIPVILTSVFDTNEDIEKGMQVGATDYLPKPFSSHIINAAISKILHAEKSVSQHTILVVDDSPIIRKIVTKGLIDAKINVICAEDGAEALTLIAERKPDLVLSDYNMPHVNGLELLEAMKSSQKYATIPFVMMSSNINQDLIRLLLGKGALSYIAKPFNMNHLIVMIEKFLSDHYLAFAEEKERIDFDRRMMLSTITSLASALEARDSYTGLHSEGVASIAVQIAEAMQTSPVDIETIRTAGLLHDIGKIGIRDEILLKTGKLDDEERRLIEQHPSIGADILSHIPSLNDVTPIVRHHHERFDGTGYPDSLKGEDIPLFARILTVADVFHALTSKRPYRKELSYEKAFEIMKEGDEKIFCPTCLAAFLSLDGLYCPIKQSKVAFI